MSSGFDKIWVVDNVILAMCCYCFQPVEKAQLTTIYGDINFTKTDVCITCTAQEHLAMHKYWSI